MTYVKQSTRWSFYNRKNIIYVMFFCQEYYLLFLMGVLCEEEGDYCNQKEEGDYSWN